MPFKDLREFIAKLEKEGEAQKIEEEIDWNLEAGAMIRRSAEKGLPAPFFENIKGYQEGYRLFGEVLGKQRRIAIAMDMDPNSHPREMIEEYLRRKQQPIKPVMVNDGPCKENIQVGDEVNLHEFPVPMIHDGDGGRYIGAWHLTICKELDSDWVNWSMQRHMLHNRNTVAIQANPVSHLLAILNQSWRPRNIPMEIAIAIGTEPISSFCAATFIPYGVSEVDVAGALRGEPVELIKCETVGLAVPATAEIVIEGEIALDEAREEGPFGEFTGYRGGHRELRPVIHVKAVTHRNNPILTTGSEGIPVTNSHTIFSIGTAAECLEKLRARGLPVTAVSVPPEAANLMVVVALKAAFPKAVDDVVDVVWATSRGLPWTIIVEDDVDPFDLSQVVHALVSKCHPVRGIIRQEHIGTSALIPWLTRHEQKYSLGARACFKCTWPPDWEPSDIPVRCSFENVYPLEVQQKALAKWAKYGY